MRLLPSVIASLVPIALHGARLPQEPTESAPTLQVRFPSSLLYKDGREVSLKQISLRRVRYAPIRRDQRGAYLKIEVWFTNADIDACAQPEIGEISDFSFSSDSSFVLVWQGGDLGKPEDLSQTFLGSTVFAESWKESRNMPIVLVWSTSSLRDLREIFPDQAVNLAGVIEQKYQNLTILPKDTKSVPENRTFAWIMNHSSWTVFHSQAKNGRYNEDFSLPVKVSKGVSSPVVEFFGRPRSVGVAGRLPPLHLCPGVLEERRHFWFDKPAKKATP